MTVRDALRREIAQRRNRTRHFDADLFGEPAWDLLLDLALARIESRHISVTSACIASGVPATTALRYIGRLIDRGLVVREGDPSDRRRQWLSLSDDAFARMGALVRANMADRVADAEREAA
jgi:DNA-binding MarR family transcriptional regulator